jgi:6-phosphogluconolactonase (cycloisomerase 2 family)
MAVASDGTYYFQGTVANGTPYSITVRTQPQSPTQVCTATNGTGSINGADAVAQVTCATSSFALQGSVSGLAGGGLRLTNGSQFTDVSQNGDFSLAPALSGSTYTVAVSAQPTSPSQTCSVENGTGTVGNEAVTNIQVHCTANRFKVGGVVTGLTGSGLVLRSTTGDDITLAQNGAFTFPTDVDSGTPYEVSIVSLPAAPAPAQTCVFDGASSGTIQNGNVSVALNCSVNQYRIKGTVAGLLTTGLALRLDGAHEVVMNGNGVFSFDTELLSGSSFNVSVHAQPTGLPPQICTPNITSGTVTNADIDVTVICGMKPFSIGGTVSGLVGSALTLRSQPGGQVTINADGPFTFPEKVPSSLPYSVDVVFTPNGPVQTCSIDPATGVVGASDVSLNVECKTDRFAYFISQDDDRIDAYTINSSNGTLSALQTTPSITTDDAPAGIAIHPSGKFLYVTNSGVNRVSGYLINPVTGVLSALPGSSWATGGAKPINIAIERTGHFAYVSNYDGDSIAGFSIDPTTGVLTPLSGSPFASPVKPLVLAPSPVNSDLFVLNSGSGTEKMTRYSIGAGGELTSAESTVGMLLPGSMSFDPAARRIYATSLVTLQIYVYELAPDGSLSGVTPYGALSAGERIAVHPNGLFAFVSNTGISHQDLSVYALDATTGQPTEIFGSPYATGHEPDSVAIHPDGGFVFVTDIAFGGVHAYRMDTTTGALTEVSGSPFALGQSYHGIAIR